MNMFMRKPFFMHPEAGGAGVLQEAGGEQEALPGGGAKGAKGAGQPRAPARGEAAGQPPGEGNKTTGEAGTSAPPAGAGESKTPPAKEPDGETPPAAQKAAPRFTPEQEAQIERLLDRRTHRLGNQVKELETQLAERQAKLAEHMSADELRQVELDEKEAQLAQQQAELALERSQRCAAESIMAAGLGQNTELALRLRDFVMAEDEEGIYKRVEMFKELLQSYVAQDVQRVFKAGGRQPAAGEGPTQQAGYSLRINQAMRSGSPSEAAYWARKQAEENKGG